MHYNDPPSQHADDVEDITDRVPQTPEQRAANPGVRFIVPKGDRVSLTLAGRDIESLLEQINAEYQSRGFPGRFRIVER